MPVLPTVALLVAAARAPAPGGDLAIGRPYWLRARSEPAGVRRLARPYARARGIWFWEILDPASGERRGELRIPEARLGDYEIAPAPEPARPRTRGAPEPSSALPPMPALRDPPPGADSLVVFELSVTRTKILRSRDRVEAVARARGARREDLARLKARLEALRASVRALAPLPSDPARREALARKLRALGEELADLDAIFRTRLEEADRLVEDWIACEQGLADLAKALHAPSGAPDDARRRSHALYERVRGAEKRLGGIAYRLARGTGIPRIDIEAGRLERAIAGYGESVAREQAIASELPAHRRAIEASFPGAVIRSIRVVWEPGHPDPVLEAFLRDPRARVDEDRETRGFRGDLVLRLPEALDRIFSAESRTQRVRIVFEVPVWDARYGRVAWKARYGSTRRPIARREYERFEDVPREEMLRRLGVALPPREEIPAPPVAPAVQRWLAGLRPKIEKIFEAVGARLVGLEPREGALRLTVRDPASRADPETGTATPPRPECFEHAVDALRLIFEEGSPFRRAQFTLLGEKVDGRYLRVVDDPYASQVIARREFLRYNWPVIDAREGGRLHALRKMGFRLPPPPEAPEEGGSRLPIIIALLAGLGALGLWLWRRR